MSNDLIQDTAAAINDSIDRGDEFRTLFSEAVSVSAENWSELDALTLSYRANSLGVEKIDAQDVKNAAIAAKNGIKAGATRFGRFLQDVAAWADNTGTKRIALLRKDLEKMGGGESGGTLIDGKLARRLSDGRGLSKDIAGGVQDLVGYNDEMRSKTIPHLVAMADELGHALGENLPDNAEKFTIVVEKVIGILSKIDGPQTFLSKQAIDTRFLGQRTAFVAMPKPNELTDHRKIRDRESLKVREVYEKSELTISKGAAKDGVRHTVNDRVELLDHRECLELLDAMEKLTDQLRMLKQTRYRTMVSLPELATWAEVIHDYAKGELVEDSDGAIVDTSIQLDSDDLVRMEWAVKLCENRIYDFHSIVQTTWLMNHSILDACFDYVKLSMKKFR